MKKLIFILVLAFLAISSFAQYTIHVYPGAGTPINDSIDVVRNMGTLTEDVMLLLHNGTYNEVVDVSFIQSSETAKFIINSESGIADSVTINSTAEAECMYIQNSFVIIKNITLNGDDGTILDLSTGGGQPKAFINGGSVTIDSCILSAGMGACLRVIGDFSTPMYDVGNIQISNNVFKNGENAILVDHYESSIYGFYIFNNKFENQRYSNIKFNFGSSSIKNLEIVNNDIQLGDNNNQGIAVGIELSNIENDPLEGNGITKISGNKIYRNDINNVKYNGIYLYSCSGTTDGFEISNNYINIENTDTNIVGIQTDYCDSINIYHNTINVEGTKSIGYSYFGASKSQYNVNLFNNIILSGNEIIFMDMQEGLLNDNNCYYTLNAVSAFEISGSFFNFDEWKTQTSTDVNTIFANPGIQSGSIPFYTSQIIDNAVPNIGVTTDIEGLMRNPSMCDIGAKEQMFIDLGNDTTICFGDSVLLIIPAGAFSYIWNTGQIDTNSIYVSIPDTYSVTVQEVAGGPIGIDTIIVNQYTQIVSTIQDYKIPKCFGENTGYLDIATTGGAMPYSYNWQGAFIDTNKIEFLTAGDYLVTVTDINNCTEINTFNLTEPEEILANFTSDAFCGGCVGQIDINATGGYPPYSYIWSTTGTGQTITDLCSGVYSVTIVDDSLCTQIASYEINESNLAYISGNLGFSLGNVFAGHARVELYKDSLNGASEIEFIDSTIVETNGYFEFSDVNPEAFYLRGILTSDNAIYNDLYTSYYSNIEPTTLWTTATLLNLSCGDSLEDINFLMYEVATPVTGPGVFSGGISYSGLAKLMGEPVPGAEVFVEQEPNDEPIANTETDSLGNWDIGNIPVGTGYKLKVDIPGLPQLSSYEDLEVSGTKSVISGLNFFVDTLFGGGIFVDTATAIINLGSQNIEIKTYPNPVSNYLTIETEFIGDVNVSYSIIDIKGKEIVVSETENTIGKYIKTIDMSSYKSGTYIIKLRLDNSFYIRKFVKE